MAAHTPSNNYIYNKFKKRDQFLLFNMENSYRIQLVVEFFFQALPQVIIQATNNNMIGTTDADSNSDDLSEASSSS